MFFVSPAKHTSSSCVTFIASVLYDWNSIRNRKKDARFFYVRDQGDADYISRDHRGINCVSNVSWRSMRRFNKKGKPAVSRQRCYVNVSRLVNASVCRETPLHPPRTRLLLSMARRAWRKHRLRVLWKKNSTERK